MRTVFAFVVALAVCFTASAIFAEMQQDIDRATTIINEFKQMPEQSIPPKVIEDSKGIAIITVGKAGFILSGRGGGGVIVTKTANGWSAPSSVVIGGAGLGFQIGADITDFVFVLNSPMAVEAFLKGDNVTIGGNLTATAGPVGRAAEVGVGSSAIYAYSRSKGLFAGVSAEGTVLAEGKKTNELFYGKPITAQEILSGTVPHPASASALYQALDSYTPKAQSVTTTTTTTATK
jgi:lipid-binding SYLF domain-containing protein